MKTVKSSFNLLCRWHSKLLSISFFLVLPSLLSAQTSGCYTIKNVDTNGYLSHNGMYSIEYYANRENPDGWEKFYLTDLGNSKYTIYGEDGKFLSAQPCVFPNAASFVWKADVPKDWEIWKIEPAKEQAGGATQYKFTTHHNTQLFTGSIQRVFVVNFIASYADKDRFVSKNKPVTNEYRWIIEPSTGCKQPPAH